ncbi:MAG: hypothetical protein H6964_04120 [Chromatiaceae bacterium]|nr:hypothetical protein [Chromatiaceae bacterium]
MIRAALLLLLGMLLAACGSTPPTESQPETERQSLNRSARLAFVQAQYAQAVTLYAAALNEALAEDLPAAIIDARFNLALSQTYLGQYDAALEQIEQADAERIRRDLGSDAELQLLRAIVHYRAGRPDAALQAINPLLALPDIAPATADRAHFMAGLIAADGNNTQAADFHLRAMSGTPAADTQTDRVELAGRLAGIRGNTAEALQLLDLAIQARSIARDYRGMVRALAAAGTLAADAGRLPLAADYFLRAGRSAAQRQEPDARAWLQRALELGKRSGDDALILEAGSLLERMGRQD